MKKTLTVAEAIVELQKLDPNASLFVGTGWDLKVTPVAEVEEHSGKAWIVPGQSEEVYPRVGTSRRIL